MKTVQLSGSPRENVGKKSSATLRREGRVPAVVYGSGEQTHFHISEIEANKLIFTPDVYKVELDVDGAKKNTFVKDVQLHPVKDTIMHLDFMEMIDGKPVKIKLPVRIIGNSIGVRNGGKLAQIFRKLTVLANAADLPEEIVVDITQLKIGQKVRVSDLSFDGLSFLEPESAVVVAVNAARGAMAGSEEEEEESSDSEEKSE